MPRSPTDAPRKILLVANTCWYLYNFRGGLVRALVADGHDVVAVCPEDQYVPRLQAAGVRWADWPLDRAGMGPLGEWSALRALQRIYRRESPDLVHHFTIKSILYGTWAARRSGVQRAVNSVTGLGHVFVSHRPAARLVRPWIRRWYVWALTAPGVQPVFQNADDLAELSRSSPELARRAVMSNGSGVDLQHFAPAANPSRDALGLPCVLFVGRLLEEKGIREFVEAARLTQQQGITARFVACGAPDLGNPSSIDPGSLDRWRREGLVEFPGHVDGIEPQMRQADVVVLPSYREGTPRVLIEAAAMGKPVIASDVPGCREVVTHGQNGLLVPPRDSAALADALQRVLADAPLCASMGQAGRAMAVQRFDERQVVRQTLGVYQELLASQPGADGGRSVARLDKGVMLLSLDFELAWGTRGRPAARHCGPFWAGTRGAIAGLLQLLARHQVPATWAIVGGLLLGRQGATSRHAWLADPSFADVPPGDAVSQPNWYADDVVDKIVAGGPDQEIACHTLTHRFIDPSAQGRQTLRDELRRFRELCEQRQLKQPTTFIFPKAKMAHFDVLAAEGFRCIRGPESGWFESLPGTRLPAALRLIDARLVRPPKVDLPERLPCGLWSLPSSQFYSPFFSVGKHVSVQARVRKAIKGLRRAAECKAVYHLWTHPFNLGVRTAELLDGIDQILREARRLCDAGQLELISMGEMARRLDRSRNR
jgi:glycosyltransferase involved in cell wall biosynthesis